ncbi:MAG TPA: hypothetical protein VIN59_06920 [Alphaproteobacteria bacterium]
MIYLLCHLQLWVLERMRLLFAVASLGALYKVGTIWYDNAQMIQVIVGA